MPVTDVKTMKKKAKQQMIRSEIFGESRENVEEFRHVS